MTSGHRSSGDEAATLQPVPGSFVPVGAQFDGTVGAPLDAGDGWFVAKAIMADGRPALVLDEGTSGGVLRPQGDGDGLSVLVYDSIQARAAYAATQSWWTQGAGSPRTLLGHLASTRAEVFTQAEVLCTLSLAWILRRSDEASRAFGQLLGVDSGLAWLAEDLFAGVPGRPDLVGRVAPESPPMVIVEAKLGAPLDEGQLRDYERNGCSLVVLVPQARVAGTLGSIKRWGLRVRVVSWDNVLGAIGAAAVAQPAYAADVAQLVDLYRQVERTWVPPFSVLELADPGARVADRVKLADQVSAFLHQSIVRARAIPSNMLPMQRSRYRYVSMQPGMATATHVAIGVFDEVHDLPLAVRWQKATVGFGEAVARLEAGGVAPRRHDGEVYVPLVLFANSAHHDMINDLLTQVCHLIEVAEPNLRPLGFTTDDAGAFISEADWRFSSTMPQWPHEYTVREWRPDLGGQFFDFVALIRRDGITKPWPLDAATPRYHHTYLALDGWEYWTMGEPIPETALINRARLVRAK